MRILLQKFGGTSVATADSRALVIEKIKYALGQGLKPVVVVSAMGRKGQPYATDTLLGVAKEPNPSVSKRELDLIMYCGEMISTVVMTSSLQAEGLPAEMLTGGQAGIITDEHFGDARIVRIDPNRVLKSLTEGKIPVVCGFQGVTEAGDLTTLGRGGSDTTASALGVALDAEAIEIYTDVDGIMTADPRVVPTARILDRASYAEVSQLAQQGAKVIHPRAVEIAMQRSVPLIIRSTFSNLPGTLITNTTNEHVGADVGVTDKIATGVTYMKNIEQFTVLPSSSNNAGNSIEVFRVLADAGINVDFINVLPDRILFTVKQEERAAAEKMLNENGYNILVRNQCAKVSVVGGGMRDVPGVMACFAQALSQNGIPLLQTVDSHTSICGLIDESHTDKAVVALHRKFGLE